MKSTLRGLSQSGIEIPLSDESNAVQPYQSEALALSRDSRDSLAPGPDRTYFKIFDSNIVGSGCSWMKRKLDEGKPHEKLGTGLSFWLGGLGASLIKAVHAIKRLGLELQIIDRVSYAALVPLIHGGHSPTLSLVYTCGDLFGAGLVAYDEHLLLGIDNFNAAAEAFEPTIDPVRMTRIMRSSFRQMQTNIDVQRTVLRGLSSIPARRLSEFQNYLEDEKPRERLAAIEQALEGLRDVLEKNFSIADVLLNVRDIRACPEDRFGLTKWF